MRAALVTGSSRGIGAAVARALAADGWVLAVHAGRDAAAADAVRGSLAGDGHVSVVGDLANPDVSADVVRQVLSRLGALDLLVNNAAVFEAQPVLTTSYEEWQAAWQRTVALNLLAPANLTWLVVEHWQASGRRGRVVNVGSRGAYRGEPVSPAYGATKAGLHALTQSLAVALAPLGVVCAAVAPGFVETDMARSVLESPEGDAVRAQSPFGRVAAADEVAEVVRWLASDAPEWVSGSVLDVNGASYLR